MRPIAARALTVVLALGGAFGAFVVPRVLVGSTPATPALTISAPASLPTPVIHVPESVLPATAPARVTAPRVRVSTPERSSTPERAVPSGQLVTRAPVPAARGQRPPVSAPKPPAPSQPVLEPAPAPVPTPVPTPVPLSRLSLDRAYTQTHADGLCFAAQFHVSKFAARARVTRRPCGQQVRACPCTVA